MSEVIELGVDAVEEGAEAAMGITARSTTDAAANLAAQQAASRAAVSEAETAARDLLPEMGTEGSTTAPASRVANYNSGAPMSWAAATPKIIGVSAVAVGGGWAEWYSMQTVDQGKRVLGNFGNDVAAGGKKALEEMEKALAELEHGVKDAFQNAELARDHLGDAVSDFASGPVKSIVEISASVAIGVGLLYVGFRGYMFLKGSSR